MSPATEAAEKYAEASAEIRATKAACNSATVGVASTETV